MKRSFGQVGGMAVKEEGDSVTEDIPLNKDKRDDYTRKREVWETA